MRLPVAAGARIERPSLLDCEVAKKPSRQVTPTARSIWPRLRSFGRVIADAPRDRRKRVVANEGDRQAFCSLFAGFLPARTGPLYVFACRARAAVTWRQPVNISPGIVRHDHLWLTVREFLDVERDGERMMRCSFSSPAAASSPYSANMRRRSPEVGRGVELCALEEMREAALAPDIR